MKLRTLFSYPRVFSDEPRSFELWLSDVDDIRAGTPSPLPHHTNRRTFELSIDLTCIAPLHSGYGPCNVTSPNINSGRHICWTRHPHVHLPAAAQPLFDSRGIEHRRPEEERREML
ncbi:hypothetical protein TNCV_3021221 [Trichonephila clavipes]|nr:hypothetical protein TNCV_3021221 [Trichonephila clavipes]